MKRIRIVVAAGMVSLLGVGASPVAAKSMVYFNGFPAPGAAYLVDWQPKSRTRVVSGVGASVGVYTDDGSQRVITLNPPIESAWVVEPDACGAAELVRQIKQVIVRDLPAETQIVEIGQDVWRGGCSDGDTTPFGSFDDVGTSMQRMSMGARPPMTDIVPGLEMAGPSDEDWPLMIDFWPAQATVSVQSGAVMFKGAGHVYPAAFSPDGWWVMDLAGHQRTQTRLRVDAKTGGEFWLMADWANGLAQRVTAVSFAKTSLDAGFGTVAKAARMWQYGGSVGTSSPFFHYLYKSGWGERVTKSLDTGGETRAPIDAWGLDEADLWEQRKLSNSSILLNRRWVPVSRHGNKIHWVIEHYESMQDGVTTVLLPARVNYLVDTGKAVPPAR
ncbi:hypothetical protein [Ideonella sp.]|uniref:hypothetical protein n=1 Tax=Ideonella sp. TaxID=1929293 RepID=UPI0035AFB5C5